MKIEQFLSRYTGDKEYYIYLLERNDNTTELTKNSMRDVYNGDIEEMPYKYVSKTIKEWWIEDICIYVIVE